MIPVVVACIVVAMLLGFFVWLPGHLRRNPARRPRSSSPTAGLLASAEEAWHPSGSAEQRILDEQQRWVEPAPTPDDDSRPEDSIIRIRL